MIDYDKMLHRVLDECDDSPERDSVLVNIGAEAYTREQDLEADIADLKRRDASRAAAQKEAQ